MRSRKEIKESYKEMKFQIGVYQIRNISNNKIFIGSSTNLAAIWNRQKFQLNYGSHPNSILQKEWNEYGQENFVFEVISEIKQDDDKPMNYQKEIKSLEAMFIEELKPFDDQGFNEKIKK
ncbi:MAG: GIY-YIG nuclease family protein [Saprospiraceae bacterium]|nr:GIY-YIG nuclease family protein [Saprospiraceae bacterium]